MHFVFFWILAWFLKILALFEEQAFKYSKKGAHLVGRVVSHDDNPHKM